MNLTTLAALLSSRKFTVALLALAGSLAVVFGADPAKWTSLLTVILTLAGLIISTIAHEDAAEKSALGGLTVEETLQRTPARPDAPPVGGLVQNNIEIKNTGESPVPLSNPKNMGETPMPREESLQKELP